MYFLHNLAAIKATLTILKRKTNAQDSPADRLLPRVRKTFPQWVRQVCRISHDDGALQGIRIPDDISLLGVDNDEFMCNISSPTLSSIKLNFEKHGYEIAQTLFKMVYQNRIWPARIAVEAVGVVERMSTKRKVISDPYIREIVAGDDGAARKHRSEQIGIHRQQQFLDDFQEIQGNDPYRIQKKEQAITNTL